MGNVRTEGTKARSCISGTHSGHIRNSLRAMCGSDRRVFSFCGAFSQAIQNSDLLCVCSGRLGARTFLGSWWP